MRKNSSYHVVRVAGLGDCYPTLPIRTESLLMLGGSSGQLSSSGNNVVHHVYSCDEEVHQDVFAYYDDM